MVEILPIVLENSKDAVNIFVNVRMICIKVCLVQGCRTWKNRSRKKKRQKEKTQFFLSWDSFHFPLSVWGQEVTLTCWHLSSGLLPYLRFCVMAICFYFYGCCFPPTPRVFLIKFVGLSKAWCEWSSKTRSKAVKMDDVNNFDQKVEADPFMLSPLYAIDIFSLPQFGLGSQMLNCP